METPSGSCFICFDGLDGVVEYSTTNKKEKNKNKNEKRKKTETIEVLHIIE